jgi:hypothetical protein
MVSVATQTTLVSAPPPAITTTLASASPSSKPKLEVKAVKNLAQELGARTKEVAAAAVRKSSTEKKDKAAEAAPKSPKVSRQESVERTMQRISKAIRGSSRSESRSKKTRDASPSPKGDDKAKADKKSAHEKREMFKSLH